MRIEIRKSGGDACETCGATELIYVPSEPAHLEAEVGAALVAAYAAATETLRAEVPRWRLIRRRTVRLALKHAAGLDVQAAVDQACDDLRRLTVRDIA